jgi:hypothetical protein
MASVRPMLWGAIVSLTREEACFAAGGIPVAEALVMSSVPQPWGTIAVGVIRLHKMVIGRNTGSDGADLHINWGGFLHYVARRGDYVACT